MIKNILFDMDGTLINTIQDKHNEKYFTEIAKTFFEHDLDGNKAIETLFKALNMMENNNGDCTNKEIIYKLFNDNFENLDIDRLFNNFYETKYDNVKDCVFKEDIAVKAINLLKDKGYNLILATNSYFPIEAVKKRLSWGNIDSNVFSYITTFDNSNYSKPNINYYKQIIEKNNLNIGETIMFGNDLKDDFIIEKMGIPCYIITDHILNEEKIKECNKKGNYNDFYNYINSLPNIK